MHGAVAMMLSRVVATRGAVRHMSGLPYRIRAPLAKLQARKHKPQEGATEATLGDGEKLETTDGPPDYVRLALTSRVYDMVGETPLQYASGLSQRLNAKVHLKREDLLPSFTFKIRGAYNQLAHMPPGTKVVTYSVGSQGMSVACAAAALGIEATIVMPERTPIKRRDAIARAGAQVVIHGRSLKDAMAEAIRLSEGTPEMSFLQPHDDAHVIAGHATAGLELVKQAGAALEGSNAEQLDAVYVVAGGSSLLAGVAAVMKAIMPSTKVIGVEPETADLLHRSLLTGHCLTAPEPAHFVDGAAVTQLGPEVFRLCNELVDDVVTVSNDEICAAVRDCFEDTRAMLEPAGAIAVAGLKKHLNAMPVGPSGSKGNYVVFSSDASNIEFDVLRFIAERAAIGEQKEKLFALRMPDRAGMFKDMYNAVQPRRVTEFTFRHSPAHEDALVYMAIERADSETHDYDVASVVESLESLGVRTLDITGDEMAKTHSRYLGGGRPGDMPGEKVIRFEFPETPGALANFLNSLEEDWFLTMRETLASRPSQYLPPARARARSHSTSARLAWAWALCPGPRSTTIYPLRDRRLAAR